MIKQHKLSNIALALTAVALTNCGGGGGNGDDNTPDPNNNANIPENVSVKQIDATAGGFGTPANDPANKYTYFNLATNEVVELSDDEAATSTDWHIAFKRTVTKLNGGVSGPGTVTGAVADEQSDFYDEEGNAVASVFLNADADSELNALVDVTDISTLRFGSDRNIAAITGDGGDESWWLYNPQGHSISAGTDNWWLVRSTEGNSYAKLHVTDIVQDSRDITLELFIQDVDQASFSSTPVTYTAAIGAAGGSKCYDIDSTTEVDCDTASDTWDLKIEVTGRAWDIWTNGGVSGSGDGAAFGPLNTETASEYVNALSSPNDVSLAGLYSNDSSGGVFADDSWYAYGVQGGNSLWPNYRVYAIDTGTEIYALQVLSYYDESGTSGMITLRHKQL